MSLSALIYFFYELERKKAQNLSRSAKLRARSRTGELVSALIRNYRQENTDFQETMKRDLQKQRDRMDVELR